jgi:hypothetical protein
MIELYVSDIQFPYQEQEAFDIVVEVARDIKPDILFLGGDIVDFYQLSKFSTDPKRKLELQQDIDNANANLEKLISKAPRTIWQEGNHENRLTRYLWGKGEELSSLRALTLPELFKFEEYGIEFVPRTLGHPYRIGELGHIHGDELAKGGSHAAEKTMRRAPGNYLFGHHHVIDVFYYRLANGKTYVSQGNGCLCSLTPEYVLMPQWQQSFTVVKYTKSGTFDLNVVPFFRHDGVMQCVLDGKTYSLAAKGKKEKK